MSEYAIDVKKPAPLRLDHVNLPVEVRQIWMEPAVSPPGVGKEVRNRDEPLPMEKWMLPAQAENYLYPRANDPL